MSIGFTINFNSGGNHGHQLKDALGALTIGHLYGLRYVHSKYPYLDFFGLGYKNPKLNKWLYRFKYKKIVKISGPIWDGVDSYEEMRVFFDEKLSKIENGTLIIFENAIRIHPFQTIPWYHEGLIKTNIFSKIQQEFSEKFCELHHLERNKVSKPIEIAIHINRGKDYDIEKYPDHFSNSTSVRFMFPMSYYDNIIKKIEDFYDFENVRFTIYTEKLNSEEIMEKFGNRKNIKINLGSNRDDKNNEQIHSIFKKFVEADILVCCNSSFSAVCTYFRRGKKTIYHPHKHLNYLPEPDYIKTDENGNFDAKLLQKV